MRTPGNDEELDIGFLFSEKILCDIMDVLSVRHCENAFHDSGKQTVIRVKLKSGVEFYPSSISRNFYATSSCGICGKASLEAIATNCKSIEDMDFKLSAELLKLLPQKLKEVQSAFKMTGGIHACALFNKLGDLVDFREDVGRHNALDKLIGAGINTKFDFSQSLLLLSGRASFELIQKAAMVGIPIVAAIGAPSSLAVDLAKSMNITLCGFLNETGFNIYHEPKRIL
jgi:FdhD protein